MTKRNFRYDEENAMLQWIQPLDEQMVQDNIEWNKKFGHDLWENENGYYIVSQIGLAKEDWDESHEYWIERFNEEIDAELRYMSQSL